MIIEFYKTTEDRLVENDYVISHLGGMVNAQTTNPQRLEQLGVGDELIVANAATLSCEPMNFLWVVNQLLAQGVIIHFVNEAQILSPHTQQNTQEFTQQILRLIASLLVSSQPAQGSSASFSSPSGSQSVGSTFFKSSNTKH